MFQFKQFAVSDEGCAMKVGTDGVLVGAWTIQKIREKQLFDDGRKRLNVLDVGAGSGLISLMLAQELDNAMITAVDVDKSACETATDNFVRSKWKGRLVCYNQKVQELRFENYFDLIVSNPPFFENSLLPPLKERALARHNESLSTAELVDNVNRMLTSVGCFSVIIPYAQEKDFIELATKYQLQATDICRVKGAEKKAFKRSMIFFEKINLNGENVVQTADFYPKVTELTLMKDSKRSAEYSFLTRDFYL